MYSQNLNPSANGRTNVTAAADMYAAGWVFFEVLCGLSPLLFLEASIDDEFAASKLTILQWCISDGSLSHTVHWHGGQVHSKNDCKMHQLTTLCMV